MAFLQGVLVRMKRNSWLLSAVLGSPSLVPTLSLTPCTSPHLPRSLPNPVTPCGPGVWEEEAGIPLGKPAQLPHSCKCQNVFPFLKSPQICNSAAVSLNMCSWPWEAPWPQPQPQHCPPGYVRVAWQGTWASLHPLRASVFPSGRGE